MKKAFDYIRKIPRERLVLANQIVFLLIVATLFYPLLGSNNKKLYASDDWLVQKSAQTLFTDCLNKGNKEECYKSGFEKLIKSHNFSLAEQALYALQDLDEGVKSCHVLSHYLSRTAVTKNPTDWKYFLENVNVNTCGSGFLHGVLEAHLGDNPDTEFSGELGNEVCNTGTDSYRKRMCMHFMGHFFVVNANNKVDEAIPLCDPVVPELKFDCLDGVFMEHHQRIALDDHGLADLPNYTPEYAGSLAKNCLNYNGQTSSACWTEMAEVYAKTFGYSAKALYDKCYNTGASPRDGRSCYNKAIVLQASYPYNVTTEKLVAICEFYKNKNDYEQCTSSVISSLLYYSPKFIHRGIALCSNITRDQNICFKEIGRQLKNFVPLAEERGKLCLVENETHKNLCVNS